MSYARTSGAQSEIYQNICRSIRLSERYHGYSMAAAEYLLRSILSRENVEPQHQRVDYLNILKEQHPADYWKVTTKVRKNDSPKVVRDSARHACYYLRGAKIKNYLTFKGQRFQISHLKVGVQFITAMVPEENWINYPWPTTIYRIIREKGTAEFKFHGGCAKFEVVK